jgi:hypothetical protein
MDIAQVPLSETLAYTMYLTASGRGMISTKICLYIDDVQFVKSPCDQYPINSHPDKTDYCYTSENATCDFEDSTFCSWYDFDHQWKIFNTSSGNTLIHLKNNAAHGTLRNQRFCSNSTIYCLSFRYAFSMNYSIDLRVDIVNAETLTVTKVWLASTPVSDPGKDDHFDLTKIPIDIPKDFYIKFEVSRRVGMPQEGRSVYIDDVELVKSPCSLSPPCASPDYCHPIGSLNCSFQDSTFCGWNSVIDSWSFVNTSSGNALIGLKNNAAHGTLRSQRFCSNSSAMHCLLFRFRYAFFMNYSMDLRVDIVSTVSSKATTVWMASTSVSDSGKGDYLDIAEIPIFTKNDIYIKFEASRRAGVPQEGRSVFIDDVELVESPCSLSPPSDDLDYYFPIGPLTCSFQDSTFCGWSSVTDSWNFVNTSSGNTLIQH